MKLPLGIYLGLFFLALLFTPFHNAFGMADSSAAIRNTEGTEFWLCFQRNFRESASSNSTDQRDPLNLDLFITANETTWVKVEIDGIRFSERIEVKGGTVRQIKINSAAQVKGEETKQRLAIHVTSEKPISVYGLNRRFQTTDTYLGLPTTVLGTEYRAMCYRWSDGLLSQMAVIGTQDETKVRITPSVRTSKAQEANRPFTVTLNKGDVYQISAFSDPGSTCDLTGSLITSDKPIAVFSGHQCAYVPSGLIGCNHLVEQLPPVTAWGRHYYLGQFENRSRYSFRVLAHQDNTSIFQDNKLLKVLRAGEFYEGSERKNIQVTSDKPVLVSQYSQGFQNGDNIGDPMMLLISPTQQFLSAYRFATPVSGEWRHYINVVVPTAKISSLRLNGQRVDTQIFQTLGLSRYSMAALQIQYGTHTITCDEPFGLYSYGFGYGGQAYDAYGNMTGQSFLPVDDIKDTLPPIPDYRELDGKINLIVRDDRTTDKGLKSVTLEFAENIEVAGKPVKIDPGSAQASLFYRPINPGASGRMVVKAVDLALNETFLTICYNYDAVVNRYRFNYSEGREALCFTESGWHAGAYLVSSFNTHTLNVQQGIGIGAVDLASSTNDMGFGFLLGKTLSSRFSANARLQVDRVSAQVGASPVNPTRVRDSITGQLLTLIEERTFAPSTWWISAVFNGEYNFSRYMYLTGGIRMGLGISRSARIGRSIYQPPNYVYRETGTGTITDSEGGIDDISVFRLSGYGGIGLSQPLTYSSSLFVEAAYNYNFGSLMTIDTWNLSQVMVNVGARYRW